MRITVTITLTAVAITAALMASCNKETGDMGTGMTFRATSESVSANGKVEYNGGQLLWQSGDQISIYDAVSNAAVFALASGEGTANAVFSQLSGTNIGATPYTAVYITAGIAMANAKSSIKTGMPKTVYQSRQNNQRLRPTLIRVNER